MESQCSDFLQSVQNCRASNRDHLCLYLQGVVPGGQKCDIHSTCRAGTVMRLPGLEPPKYAYTPMSPISGLAVLSNYSNGLNTTSFVSRPPRKGLFAPVQTPHFLVGHQYYIRCLLLNVLCGNNFEKKVKALCLQK